MQPLSERDRMAFTTALLLGADVTPATHYYTGSDNRGRMTFRCKLTGKRVYA
jgi:hypothetical protein